MEKILFVIHNLEIGGIQRSLIELLKLIHPYYDITLYCIDYRGAYISEIPSSVKIIRGNRYATNPERTKQQCRNLGVKDYVLHIFNNGWSRLFGRKYPAKLITFLSGKIEGKYDVAISFAQPSNDRYCISLTNEYVLYNCVAKKKVTFLHSDFEKYGGNTQYTKWLYKRFDIIAAVSNSVQKKLIGILPEIKEKTIVVRNACDNTTIIRMAEENAVSYSKYTIVSVSRLGPEKGLTRCLSLCRKLIDEGGDFEWHIVGDGVEKRKIQEGIVKYHLEKIVFLEGNQTNPYRYMKNAKALFLPSFHEAAPMVFHEAATLGLWLLTTDTLSANELVSDKGIGYVCPNNEEGIYYMLKRFLIEKPMQRKDFDSAQLNTEVKEQFKLMINK